MLLCVAYLRFRVDMEGSLDTATKQTLAKVMKVKAASSWVPHGIES